MHYELTNRVHGHKITANSEHSRDDLQKTLDKTDNLPIWQVTKEFDPEPPARPKVELSDDDLLALLDERGLLGLQIKMTDGESVVTKEQVLESKPKAPAKKKAAPKKKAK